VENINGQARKMYMKGQEVISIKALACPLEELFQFDYERE
jgi:hypothetical protein